MIILDPRPIPGPQVPDVPQDGASQALRAVVGNLQAALRELDTAMSLAIPAGEHADGEALWFAEGIRMDADRALSWARSLEQNFAARGAS